MCQNEQYHLVQLALVRNHYKVWSVMFNSVGKQRYHTDAFCTDFQRIAVSKHVTAKPGYSPRQDPFGASILHTRAQNRHLIIRTSCPTGHCEKVGKMVMSACLPITGIYASLTLELVKLEANLLALTMFRVITPTILGVETQFLVVLTHGRNHRVHRVHNRSHHYLKTSAGMSIYGAH